jgi:hypothetical protein
MADYTLTYDDGVEGWTSFFSFIPDWMQGMNQFFYTFKGGNLYKHNSNPVRNNFYGVQYNSQIQSVFNDVPLENKLFKTLNLEGDDAWGATLVTDIQDTGFIDAAWFEKKEQSWYAFVRNSGTTPADPVQNYPLRSLNGIGRSVSIDATNPAAVIINFSISPLVAIGKIISIGDNLYLTLPPSYSTPVFVGEVVNVVVNYRGGDNYIVVDTTVPSGSIPGIQDAYYMFIKNSVAESHGVLGHWCVFTLTNTETDRSELFAVESSVMKSFP